jgi:hypothetical protein
MVLAAPGSTWAVGVGGVSKGDGIAFGAAGVAAWMLATAFYVAFGGSLLERAFWFYALNAFLIAAGYGLLFVAVARLRRVPCRRRSLPALVFAAPGVVGAAVVLSNFGQLFPDLSPASLGRYGAYLFVGFAALTLLALERPRAKT